jgi:hypothetical protein
VEQEHVPSLSDLFDFERYRESPTEDLGKNLFFVAEVGEEVVDAEIESKLSLGADLSDNRLTVLAVENGDSVGELGIFDLGELEVEAVGKTARRIERY